MGSYREPGGGEDKLSLLHSSFSHVFLQEALNYYLYLRAHTHETESSLFI